MIHVAYHANCYDGFGAAWAAWRKLGDEGVEYRAVSYGEAPLDLHNTDQGKLYLLDFSYQRKILLMLAKEFDITVLDHHKTAKADLEGLPFATFDLEKSGAVLAWEHFHPGDPVPLMLKYLEDRDLWRFALPGSREVSQWMRSWPFDFLRWDHLNILFDESLENIIAEGVALLRFQDQQVGLMADRVEWITLAGHRVPCVNATLFFSEVGEELCKRHPEAPFSAYYLDWPDRRQWGLRSRAGFDCSVVAKAYRGGGHPGAAGFITDRTWRGDTP